MEDEDAFSSGITASDLMASAGRVGFMKFLESLKGDPDVRIQIATRNKMIGFGVHPASIVDLTVARWTDLS